MSDNSYNFDPTKRQWVGYWSMIVQQTQNAFNDKMAQFVLIPLGGAVGFSVESAAGVMIALPFVVFAPIAGYMSDRFSKRNVMLGAALLQLAVLAWICGAIVMKSMPMALCGFFTLAIQSAFYGPAKMGINKELVGSKHLGFATGIQQMTAMLAILAGQIVAGWWFDKRYSLRGGVPDVAWDAALWPMMLLTVCAIPAIVLALIIPKVPAQAKEKFTLGLAVSHFASLKDLWADKRLHQAALGVSFFWGFAAFINLWSLKLAKVLTGGGEGFGTMSSGFMAAASLGMAAGFGVASMLLRKRIELGWVPLAGLLMTIFSVVLVFVPSGGTWFLISLAALAFSSAIFLAPLNAWMQDRYPANKRGEMQSAVNLMNCLSGITAVGVITLFELSVKWFGVDPVVGTCYQMFFIAVACLIATVLIIRVLPADFIRMISATIVRVFYRVRASNVERLPKEGGVLLLPNHMSYLDAFHLSVSSPRNIRFVMDDGFTKHPAVRFYLQVFDTVMIRRDQPLQAMREVIKSLKRGEVVCLFAEGQLTRTGGLCELERGFELIAKKAGHPIIPMWTDGSWGSIFSFERNRFMGKWPYWKKPTVTCAYGQVIQPEEASPERVRHEMHRASADGVAQRFASKRWKSALPKSGAAVPSVLKEMDEASCHRAWVNGAQIGRLNSLQRGQAFHVLKDDPILTQLLGLVLAFPKLFKARVVLEDKFHDQAGAVWVGSEYLCERMEGVGELQDVSFYQFGDKKMDALSIDGLAHYPCFAKEGVVVSMSMPEPKESPPGFESQNGFKAGALGKLLPGWYVDGAKVLGPAAPEGGVELPSGFDLDAESFLVG